MFQSGFLIFIIRRTDFNDFSLLQSKTIQQQYKQLIINNKISLVSSRAFNLNSLKYIMIKLGILYKEYGLLHRGLDGIECFDLKIANLLMEYILKSSSFSYIVSNLNDHFFIYSIKATIAFIISQFSKRIDKLKQSLKGKLVKSTDFHNMSSDHTEFNELLIFSKYLDILRQLDNDIHFNRKICPKSLNHQINTLSSAISSNNFEGKNINYLTNQLNTGKIANAENYIIHKIIFPSVTNIQLLKKMIVELYCYKLLQEDEQMYYFVCINILRNVCYNPNIFFKNIAMKTHVKTLRHFLIQHLKHSNFISAKEERYLSFMKYIEQHYSNPSFEVEYRVKATNTLLLKEYSTAISDNCNKNNDCTLITLTNWNESYHSFTSSINSKVNYHKLNYTKFDLDLNSDKENLLKPGPFLTQSNVKVLNSMINDSTFYSWIDYSEIYALMFFNNDINDFGLNKHLPQNSLMFIQNNAFYILQELLNNYFYDQEEKFYLLTNKMHKLECVNCKKSGTNQGDSQGLIQSTMHFGYSNISIEDIKSFTDENIYRIEIDDFLKNYNAREDINAFISLYCNDDKKISSMFNYIKGYHMQHLLSIFIQKLCDAAYFESNFIDQSTAISSRYFSSKRPFNYISTNKLHLFSLINNTDTSDSIKSSQFNKELSSLFLPQGILIDKKPGNINSTLIQELLKNNLFKVNEPLMNEYENIKENKSKVEEFITKNHQSQLYNNYSLIDNCMNRYILFHENNYYLLQAFFDINLFNPKIILSELYHSLDTWQRSIILSKFSNNDDLIFNIALENLNVITFPNENENLIFYACLIYLKKNNIEWESTLIKLTNGAFNLNKLIEQFTQMTSSILPKCSVDKVKEPIDLINTIKTHNEDISIRAIVNYFYPYLRNDNYAKWRERGLNASMHIDDFEILIENGRIIDAYYYYITHLKKETSRKELSNWLYKICFNNLLNYNVFATSVTLLQLLNENKTESKDDDDTKEIIVQVEAANRILTYELNLLSKNNDQLRSDLFNFIERKNYIVDEKTIESNTNIYFYSLEPIYKEAIMKYDVLVNQFQELKSSFNENNQKHATLIFEVLKRLEDSTWADQQNSFDQAKVNTSWHLVSLFCKINNYEMSLTNLHDFGRHNNWISFLHKAQEQDCSPMTIFTILNSYVTDEQLKKHLIIAIEPLINKSDSIYNSNEDSYLNIDKEQISLKKVLNDKINPVKSIDDYLLFTFKTEITKSQSIHHGDPLYYLTEIEKNSSNTNKSIKISNILNEALQLNWKEMLLVSLTQEETPDSDLLFTLFGLYLYMSLKEIFVYNFSFEKYANNTLLLTKLNSVFDSKRKLFRIKELKEIMQFLILNNYQHVIIEAYTLFTLPFSFDEFILFTQSISNNDFENAFVHLYVFKEMTIESFQSFNIDFNKMQLQIEQLDYISKPIECIILIFFYSLAESIISSLLFSVEKEEYKLFKLLEVLYLANWSDTISNYFKNLNVINALKNKSDLTYHTTYDEIVNHLIRQNEYDLLTEYMKSYNIENTDNVLLHKVFYSIEVFNKYYSLFTIVERNQFWDFIDQLLLSSSFSLFKTAYLFLIIINDKERKMYLKEQLYLINKTHNYFNQSSDTEEAKELQEINCFIKSKGFEVDSFTSIKKIIMKLEHTVYLIIFSSFNYDKLSSIFINSTSFNKDNILSNCLRLMTSLREDAMRISFNQSDIKEKLYIACINLINMHQLELCIDLCDYYNCQFDDIKQFESLILFFKENNSSLMELDASIIYQLYLKALDQRLVVQDQIIKYDSFAIEEQLIMNVAWFLELKSLRNQVLFELLKLTISNYISLSVERYLCFNDNIDFILSQLIQKKDCAKEMISQLNRYMDNGDRLAKIIIELFVKNKDSPELNEPLYLFDYIDFFDSPKILGTAIMKIINDIIAPSNQLTTLFHWELIMLAYYCFLVDTQHNELNSLDNTISKSIKANNQFYCHLFKVFFLCNDETKAKELFFCLNKHFLIDNDNLNGCNHLNDKDWFNKIKLQIQFYDKVKLNNKVGEIYMQLAKEYSDIIKQKKELYLNKKTSKEILEMEYKDYSNILNYYIRAAEQFGKDNFIINHNKAMEKIKALIKEQFKDIIIFK